MASRSHVSRLALAAALLLAASAPVLAGEVYGKVTTGGASVGDGATVAAQCAKRSYPATPTDKSGSYHLIVSERGKCSPVSLRRG